MAKKDLPKIVSKLKICGVTNYSDVEACIRLKVDFIGFNIYPGSKRYIKPSQILELWDHACIKYNHITPVIVSVQADPQQLIHIHQNLSGQAIFQLHGNESAEYIEELYSSIPELRIWQAVGVRAGLSPDLTHMHKKSELILFDTSKGSGPSFGGTGTTFDWNVLQNLKMPKEWGVAGGINESNIKSALQWMPHLIDVSSGAESEPGVKDHVKIQKLVESVKGNYFE